MSAIELLVAGAMAFAQSGPDQMRPIDVPYQAIPAYMIYTQCVTDHLGENSGAHSVNPSEVRQANTDAIAACSEIRAEQLARALAAQTDSRIYRNAEEALAAVRRSFDRFDSDFQVEPAAHGNRHAED